MPNVRIELSAIELRDAEMVMQSRPRVSVTANGHALGRPFVAPMGFVVHPPRPAIAEIPVDPGQAVAFSVQFGAAHFEFRVPFPTEGVIHRHEVEAITIVVALLPLGAPRTTAATATRSGAGGGRTTVVIGGPPPPVRVEIVHPVEEVFSCPTEGQVAQIVRMGLWENAWSAERRLRNGAADAEHFVGCDPRRFYLRVVDPGARDRPFVRVSLRTLFSDGRPCDAGGADPTITCERVDARAGIFASRAQMLVASEVDLAIPEVHSGDFPGGGPRSRGQADFRLRRANMFGRVEASYERATAPAIAELFGPERRTLHLEVFEVDQAIVGDDVTLGRGDHRRPLHEVWETDLRVTREVYGRIGLYVATHRRAGVERATERRFSGGSDWIAHVGSPDGATDYDSLSRALAQAYPRARAGIRVFYLRSMGGVNGASPTMAWVADHGAPAEMANISFINAMTRGPYTLAHELLHVLVNSAGSTAREQHYYGEDYVHNLLRHSGDAVRGGPPVDMSDPGADTHRMSTTESWYATSRIRMEQVSEIGRILSRL